MKLVDMRDSKSLARKSVPVRVRPPLPNLDRYSTSVVELVDTLA